MPRVPLNTPQVRGQGPQGPAFNAPATQPMRDYTGDHLQQLGSAAQKTGLQIARIAEVMQGKLDESNSADGLIQYGDFLQESLKGEKGYLRTKGQGAFKGDARKRTLDELERRRKEIEASLPTETARELFRRNSSSMTRSARDQVLSHEARELSTYKISRMQVLGEQLIEQAVSAIETGVNTRTPDLPGSTAGEGTIPLQTGAVMLGALEGTAGDAFKFAVESAEAIAHDIADERGFGMQDPQRDKLVEGVREQAYTRALNVLLESDRFDEAAAWIEKHGDKLPPGAAAKGRRIIERAKVNDRGFAAARAALGRVDNEQSDLPHRWGPTYLAEVVADIEAQYEAGQISFEEMQLAQAQAETDLNLRKAQTLENLSNIVDEERKELQRGGPHPLSPDYPEWKRERNIELGIQDEIVAAYSAIETKRSDLDTWFAVQDAFRRGELVDMTPQQFRVTFPALTDDDLKRGLALLGPQPGPEVLADQEVEREIRFLMDAVIDPDITDTNQRNRLGARLRQEVWNEVRLLRQAKSTMSPEEVRSYLHTKFVFDIMGGRAKLDLTKGRVEDVPYHISSRFQDEAFRQRFDIESEEGSEGQRQYGIEVEMVDEDGVSTVSRMFYPSDIRLESRTKIADFLRRNNTPPVFGHVLQTWIDLGMPDAVGVTPDGDLFGMDVDGARTSGQEGTWVQDVMHRRRKTFFEREKFSDPMLHHVPKYKDDGRAGQKANNVRIKGGNPVWGR